jgi:HD-GYP domain-containing protein (c-di-GMP phosphodiesterase class II)
MQPLREPTMNDKLQARMRHLEALREVSVELTSERDLQKLLTLTITRVGEILNAERNTLYLIEQDVNSPEGDTYLLVSHVAQGIEEIRLPLNETSIAGTVALTGEVINLEDAYRDPRFNPSFDHQNGFRTRTMVAAPMRNSQGRVIGVTQSINKRGARVFDRDDEEMLVAFSNLAAVAVENARYLDLQRRTFETLISGQAVAIDARDHITAGHTRRVTAYAVEIGRSLGLEEPDLELLRYGGLLHDQGKLGVPDDILLKADQLSDWEFRIIQTHAEKTKIILNAVRPFFPRRLRNIPEISASHHEKLDGSGYPDGLRGAAICLGARILAVADIFDAMTAVRPYRRPDSDDAVMRMLRRDAGAGKIDRDAVEALAKILPRIQQIRDEINEKTQHEEVRRVRRGQRVSPPMGTSGS